MDEIVRQIVDQIMRERDEFNDKYRDLQREHDRVVEGEMASLRESYVEKMNALNEELVNVREQCQVLQNQLDERVMVKQEEKEDDDAKNEKIDDVGMASWNNWGETSLAEVRHCSGG